MIAAEHSALREAGRSNAGIAAALLVGVALALLPRAIAAEDAVTLSVTIKNHKFRSAARAWSTSGRSSRAATISSTTSITRRKAT